MKIHFGDLEGVEIVVDDILVHRRNMTEHNERLEAVFVRARKLNLKLNREKFHIGQSEVKYVGHRLTANGVRTKEERIRAITNARDPINELPGARDHPGNGCLCEQVHSTPEHLDSAAARREERGLLALGTTTVCSTTEDQRQPHV